MKKYLANAAKVAVSLGLIAYLVASARNDPTFQRIDFSDPHCKWWLLAAAAACWMTSLTCGIVRWYFLVRAVGLPFRLRDAFRLGLLGYMLNFVSLGSVGGDVFKAVFLAREQPDRRAEAVATIVVDRILGLYSLFIVAAASVLLTGTLYSDVEEVRAISRWTLILTGLAGISVVMVMVPGFTTGAVSEFLQGLPRIGTVLGKLIAAVRVYRRRVGVIAGSVLLSIGVHSLSTVTIYLTARGILGTVPSLSAHFIIVPLSMLAGALPLPMMGLGAFEATLGFLYAAIPAAHALSGGQSLLVAFGYRMITIFAAIVSALAFLALRRDGETTWEAARKSAHGDLLNDESVKMASGAP
ncbi:MAG: lysylphosphatidylglycerol synthase transmembrane domain-containing protein [Pirellulales bacterium]